MLKNPVLYSTSLEKYSIPLLQLIDYNLELHLQLSVVSATDRPTGSCEEQSKHTWIAKKKRIRDGLSDSSKAEGASKSSLATLPAVKNIHNDHSTQDSLNGNNSANQIFFTTGVATSLVPGMYEKCCK